MPDLVLFLIGLLVTTVVFTAVWLVGVMESSDREARNSAPDDSLARARPGTER